MKDTISSSIVISNGDRIDSIQDTATTMNFGLFSDIETGEPVGSEILEYPASVNVFLLFHDDRVILVDTGYGYIKNGQLLGALKKLLIKPDEITDVLLTHIHPDHVGGLLDKKGKCEFPNAMIHVSKVEFELAVPGVLKYVTSYEGSVHQFDFETEPIPGITAHNGAGHTPGHTIYEINGTRVYFVGDLVHSIDLQVANPNICAQYDQAPKAAETRKKFLAIGCGNALFFGGHVPYPGYFRVTEKNGRYEYHTDVDQK